MDTGLKISITHLISILITASLFAMGNRDLVKMSDVVDLSVGWMPRAIFLSAGVEVKNKSREAREA